jgi:hypothetical protein
VRPRASRLHGVWESSESVSSGAKGVTPPRMASLSPLLHLPPLLRKCRQWTLSALSAAAAAAAGASESVTMSLYLRGGPVWGPIPNRDDRSPPAPFSTVLAEAVPPRFISPLIHLYARQCNPAFPRMLLIVYPFKYSELGPAKTSLSARLAQLFLTIDHVNPPKKRWCP